MIRFNNTDVIVGEIKQLLHTFNLPKAKVLEDQQVFYPNTIYIKDQQVFRSNEDGSAISKIDDVVYDWGDKLLNITHTLDITNNIYDSYTHKYLGEYLRFLRDYRKIDLMSMYNCFSNEIPRELYNFVTVNNKKYMFDSSDSSQIIYMIPIKLGQVYTISLNTPRPVKMVAGFYTNDGLIEDKFIEKSFRLKNSCCSNEVFIYDGVKDLVMKDLNTSVWSKEDCLYLFLSLSSGYKSSIVVLEGDYTESANVFINDSGYTEIMYKPAAYNKTLTDLAVQNIPSRSQLLAQRSEYSYPFADKLLQYLTANVITPIDEISNNIKLAQDRLNKKGYTRTINSYGTWSKEDTAACLLCSHKNIRHRELFKDFDMIGYLDSDVENELGGLQ